MRLPICSSIRTRGGAEQSKSPERTWGGGRQSREQKLLKQETGTDLRKHKDTSSCLIYCLFLTGSRLFPALPFDPAENTLEEKLAAKVQVSRTIGSPLTCSQFASIKPRLQLSHLVFCCPPGSELAALSARKPRRRSLQVSPPPGGDTTALGKAAPPAPHLAASRFQRLLVQP